MKAKVFLILRIVPLFLFLIQIQIEATPTQRHIKQHSIQAIIAATEPGFDEKLPLLLDIASNETEDTFFAYHGMSQKTRLFQDIMNAVFEEVFNIPIPKDFYFLRIPGDISWNWNNGKKSFLDYYGNKPVPKIYRDLIIQNFLLVIDNELDLHIALEELSPTEYSIFWNFFQKHIEYMYQSSWTYTASKYSLPKNYLLIEPFINKNLPALIRIIEKKSKRSYENKIFQIIDFFEKFNDDFEVTKLFYLREIELRDKDIYKKIEDLDIPFDDTSFPQNLQLLSLNISILGNYASSGCFTAGIFLDNESILGGDDNLEKILRTFFIHIGLDPELASHMWNEGQKELAETDHGCLLQFFDESGIKNENKPPMHLVDNDTYVSFKHGVPVVDLIPSKYVQGQYFVKGQGKDLELRMVMNNRTNLNPFSSIRMARHEGVSADERINIIPKLKNLLKEVSIDEEKRQNYIKLLEVLWQVPLSKEYASQHSEACFSS